MEKKITLMLVLVMVLSLSVTVSASMNDKLLDAVDNEKVEKVENLLEKGADPNAENKYYTALMIAVGNDNPKIVNLLIKNGADVNAKNKFRTVLGSVRSKEVAEILLENGANPNIRGSYGETPLWDIKKVKIVKLLVENGANINAEDNKGASLLFDAVSSFNSKKVSYLIKAGANVNDVVEKGNAKGHTPLSWAKENIVESLDQPELDKIISILRKANANDSSSSSNNSYSIKEGYSDGEFIITKNGDNWRTISTEWIDDKDQYQIHVYQGGAYWYYEPEASHMVSDEGSHHVEKFSDAIVKAAEVYINKHAN